MRGGKVLRIDFVAGPVAHRFRFGGGSCNVFEAAGGVEDRVVLVLGFGW